MSKKGGAILGQRNSRAYKGFLFQADIVFHLDTRPNDSGTRINVTHTWKRHFCAIKSRDPF